MAEVMPDWSELPRDLLVVVARCLNLIEDYSNFRSVCKSWHSAATKNNFNNDLPRVPWLMLAEEEDDEGYSVRRFFSLYNGMILNKRIPKASRKLCIESMGWLFTVAEDGESNLLHPFSGVEIQLPHQNIIPDYHEQETDWPLTYFSKAVLTANPCLTSDYVLMVTEGCKGFLTFWRPGDSRWTRVNLEGHDHDIFIDLVYVNGGQIYAVDDLSRVIVCDVADVVGPQPTKSYSIIAQIPEQPGDNREYLYIVESLGSIFVISRHGVQLRNAIDDSYRVPLTPIPSKNWPGSHEYESDNEEEEEDLSDLTYGTTEFRVYQVDLPSGKVNETRDLGDRAFFLGANTSLSVQASQFLGIKPNHIYFTDDFSQTYHTFEEGGGLDMGVFNLANGTMQPHYNGVSLSFFCPPTWVTPALY